MTKENLTCPSCGAAVNTEQNFCGECGQQLHKVCPGCETSNPPSYKFCGQCGKDLRPVGILLLDRTGMITEADSTAGNIFESHGDVILGKPFSIFVNISDRAFFFSHWNMLLNSSTAQNLEVELNPSQERKLYSHLTLEPVAGQGQAVDKVRVEIDDMTERRLKSQQLEERDSLIRLIGSMMDIFHPAKNDIRQTTINGVLERIGLLSVVPYVFVARIDEGKREIVTEFKWQAKDARPEKQAPPSIPVDSLRPVLEKLQGGKPYIIEDLSSLNAAEREAWQKWHQRSTGAGAIICELIYRENTPIGLLGIIGSESGVWPRNTMILMQLAAQCLASALPQSLPGRSVIQQAAGSANSSDNEPPEADEINDIDEVEVIIDEQEENRSQGALKKMVIESDEEADSVGALPIIATDDGGYVLKCPKCSQMEYVSIAEFTEAGWIMKVTCPCGCSFRIIREMRKMHRKEVNLDGLFARSVDDLNKLTVSSSWGAMEVTNISKSGLRFTTPQARLLDIGEEIQLRFNLDNSSKSIIKKSATIRSIQKNSVGCKFLNADKYDVTLGFYFL